MGGVFEEGARDVVYRTWLSDEDRWQGGLWFGLGHGGVEEMLLGGRSFYELLQALAFGNADLSTLAASDQGGSPGRSWMPIGPRHGMPPGRVPLNDGWRLGIR